MPFLTPALYDEVSAEAKASPRLRKNRNFHRHDGEMCHRLLNALEPGSYIQPHRHLDPNKEECMLILRGRFVCLFFDAAGHVTEHAVLSPGDVGGVVIPVGQFHTLFALDSGAVFFEAKAGPYLPLTAEEKAPWAPAEGTPEAAALMAEWQRLYGA